MDHEQDESINLTDRRYALRQPSKVDILNVEHSNGLKSEAHVLDISRQGFRLKMKDLVPCGADIIIDPPDRSELLKIRATIVRQRLVVEPDGRWFECGVEVADTAAWRKHSWFLELRADSRILDEPTHVIVGSEAA